MHCDANLNLQLTCYTFIFTYIPQYVGTKITDQKADEVSRLRILDFWTPENHYRWVTSRYGGHKSATVEAVQRSQLLLGGMCILNLLQIEMVQKLKKIFHKHFLLCIFLTFQVQMVRKVRG